MGVCGQQLGFARTDSNCFAGGHTRCFALPVRQLCGRRGVCRLSIVTFVVALMTVTSCGSVTPSPPAPVPTEAGYRDFSFGTVTTESPSGEKPESKLWWNDGSWWGSLYNDQAQAFHIYRLDVATQRWVDTGTVLDDRSDSKADVLWDEANQKLYVASHIFVASGVPTPSSASWGRLYRLTYSAGAKTYTLDAGFPVDVTRGKAETLTIAKDSFGRLWVTYVESGNVMINRSMSSDADWGEPFVLPLSPAVATVSTDDISAAMAFQADKVGVMWSNQLNSKFYFAVHQDGDADTVWQPEETPMPDSACTGACADDHINLKTDAAGRIFAAVKTSLSTSDSPLVMLLVRGQGGGWSSYIYSQVRDRDTRPLVLLDEQQGRIHVFTGSTEAGGEIRYKSTNVSNIQFAPGTGQIFIRSNRDVNINNPTATKQNLNGTTGLVVLASDYVTRFYWHNYLNLR